MGVTLQSLVLQLLLVLPCSAFMQTSIWRRPKSMEAIGYPRDTMPPVRSEVTHTVIAPSLKLMVFIDGTWLYYTMVEGRESCPIQRRYGRDWKKSHRIDYRALTQLLASNIREQLYTQSGSDRVIDLVRTSVFTSTRDDTETDSLRLKMIQDFYSSNFEVHRFVTDGPQEKCVDISLAVEMLYMATVEDGYDVACILTGDKDFIPAMQKTRLKAKRVALASMRNSCNKDLIAPEQNLRDVDVIWLDDYIDSYIVKRHTVTPSDSQGLADLVRQYLEEIPGNRTSREIGRMLQSSVLDKRNALSLLKEGFGTLSSFLQRHPQSFSLAFPEDMTPEFLVSLGGSLGDEDIQLPQEKGFGLVSSSSDLLLSLSESDITSLGLLEGGAELNGTELFKQLLDSEMAQEDLDHWVQFGLQGLDASGGGDQSEVWAVDEEAEEEGPVNLIRFYIEVLSVDAKASSRDLGRYLQDRNMSPDESVLAHLKQKYGSLKSFLTKYPGVFTVESVLGKNEFYVGLQPDPEERESQMLPNEPVITLTTSKDSIGPIEATVEVLASEPTKAHIDEAVLTQASTPKKKATSRAAPKKKSPSSLPESTTSSS